MNPAIYLIARTLISFVDLILFGMMVRMLASWFIMNDGHSKFMNFLIAFTEPAIYPIRRLCEKFGWFQNIPLDIPFLITALLLSVVTTIVENTVLI